MDAFFAHFLRWLSKPFGGSATAKLRYHLRRRIVARAKLEPRQGATSPRRYESSGFSLEGALSSTADLEAPLSGRDRLHAANVLTATSTSNAAAAGFSERRRAGSWSGAASAMPDTGGRDILPFDDDHSLRPPVVEFTGVCEHAGQLVVLKAMDWKACSLSHRWTVRTVRLRWRAISFQDSSRDEGGVPGESTREIG